MREENIFFDTKKLKYRGENVIIGKTCRIRYPEIVELHDNVIIDDFVYISTGLIMENYTVIEPNCVLMGGKSNQITIQSYASLAPHVSLLCSTNDFEQSFPGGFDAYKYQKLHSGPIVIEKYVIVGCNTTVLPGVILKEGSRIGAHSLVKKDSEPWTLYAGVPAKKIGSVNKEMTLGRISNFKLSQ